MHTHGLNPSDVRFTECLFHTLLRSPLPLPIHPTPPILAHALVPILQRQLRRRAAPHARLAVEHDLLIRRRLVEAEAVVKVGGGQGERVGLRGQRDVDGAGYRAGGLQLRGLADVDEDA